VSYNSRFISGTFNLAGILHLSRYIIDSLQTVSEVLQINKSRVKGSDLDVYENIQRIHSITDTVRFGFSNAADV
jgi:hypothetical protein